MTRHSFKLIIIITKPSKSYDRAIDINPREGMFWVNKGNVFKELRRFDEAIKAYDKAICIDSNNADAWYNKALKITLIINMS